MLLKRKEYIILYVRDQISISFFYQLTRSSPSYITWPKGLKKSIPPAMIWITFKDHIIQDKASPFPSLSLPPSLSHTRTQRNQLYFSFFNPHQCLFSQFWSTLFVKTQNLYSYYIYISLGIILWREREIRCQHMHFLVFSVCVSR